MLQEANPNQDVQSPTIGELGFAARPHEAPGHPRWMLKLGGRWKLIASETNRAAAIPIIRRALGLSIGETVATFISSLWYTVVLRLKRMVKSTNGGVKYRFTDRREC
jgi:hypothetical protein